MKACIANLIYILKKSCHRAFKPANVQYHGGEENQNFTRFSKHLRLSRYLQEHLSLRYLSFQPSSFLSSLGGKISNNEGLLQFLLIVSHSERFLVIRFCSFRGKVDRYEHFFSVEVRKRNSAEFNALKWATFTPS